MARYALGSGMAVPPWVLDVTERSRIGTYGLDRDPGRTTHSADPYQSGEWDVASLISAPPAGLDELARAHVALARLIHPATPRPVLLLNRGRQLSAGSSSGNVTRPLLALLGGFSAAMLYQILERLVHTVEALAEGDSKPAEQARHEAVTARVAAQMGEDRLGLVAELLHLRDELGTGESTKPARATVEALLAGLLPQGAGADPSGATRSRDALPDGNDRTPV